MRVRGRRRPTWTCASRRASLPTSPLLASLAAVLLLAVGLAGCLTEAAPDAGSPAPPDGTASPPDGPRVPPLHPATDGLDETVVTLVTADGEEARVDAKVAATDAERRRGLMEVERLPDGVGMLFLFDRDRTGGFWMRDTLVPLDIAFLDAQGTILALLTMEPCTAAAPADCEVHDPGRAYRAALEVGAGWFARAGVGEGDRVSWLDPSPARRASGTGST